MINDEISAIEQQIAELTAKRQALLNSRRHEAIQQVKSLIAQYGLTAVELGFRSKGRAGAEPSKAAPKYANPANPSQTWSGGKGARPKWVKEHLAKGGKLEDLLISKP
ncbi:MAG: H-NS histone family protein [Rhodocyclaceae bacterium]|nr:H-NS histone family protein [Rhodocyclaceae bacterium]